MIPVLRCLPLLCLAALGACAAPQSGKEPAPIACRACDAWNATQAPFRIVGNTYYVGVRGLSVLVVRTSAGLILFDGALPQSVSGIQENLRSLGMDIRQVRLIVNTHAHFDHAGGIAALARASGATVLASHAGAQALRNGGPLSDDPQFAFGTQANAFEVPPRVRAIDDAEQVTLGEITLTAHYTPGHTPGATTWTWRDCAGGQCLDVVYADSLNAVSAPEYSFTPIAAQFERSMDRVGALPCDVIVAVHPEFTRTFDKLELRERDPTNNPFVDKGCKAYADAARSRLRLRLAQEAAGSQQ